RRGADGYPETAHCRPWLRRRLGIPGVYDANIPWFLQGDPIGVLPTVCCHACTAFLIEIVPGEGALLPGGVCDIDHTLSDCTCFVVKGTLDYSARIFFPLRVAGKFVFMPSMT